MFTKITRPSLLTIMAAMLIFSACSKDDPEMQLARDREKILEYIAKNDLDAHEHESGIFYVMEVEGSGGHPPATATVVINYTGRLLNETVFDVANNAYIYLPGTIEGWREGIPLFKRGGKGMLLIPSGLAYGPYPRPSIPANSVLIFDIELIDF
jgi:FKBP-type peptidyl-prolyl cis-trans isomerase FkpA